MGGKGARWWGGELRPQAEQNSGNLRYPGEPGQTAGSCHLATSLLPMGLGAENQEGGSEEEPQEGVPEETAGGLQVRGEAVV